MSRTNLRRAALAAVLAAAVIPAAHAATIDELTAVQREAQAAEARKKLEQAKPPAPPAAAPAPAVPGAISTAPGAGNELPGEPPPSMARAQLVALYGVGDDLTAEFSYGASTLKATRGAALPEGWRVESINSNQVVLVKAGKNKRKPVRRYFTYSAQTITESARLQSPGALMPVQGPGLVAPVLPTLRK